MNTGFRKHHQAGTLAQLIQRVTLPSMHVSIWAKTRSGVERVLAIPDFLL